MQLGPSELILNADHSIYHLNLLPEDIAPTIITVGDPDRVGEVSKYFDSINVKKGKREFLTHTGQLRGEKITVISTGIGTDNVDIVLNELDALVNIDFKTRKVKKNRIRFKIIRIGTSGALQPEIPLDSFLLSEYAIGFDGLLHFYQSDQIQELAISDALMNHLGPAVAKVVPYVVKCDGELALKMRSNRIRTGLTATNPGFYGPQGRKLRLGPRADDHISKMADFTFAGMKLTNMEMETSGIYGLSKLLGHQAVSLNCILANRVTGEFSKNPQKAVDRLIQYALEKLTT
jgi:uridine phosphorylase